jgi:putative hydrolase of the HAD superfamily
MSTQEIAAVSFDADNTLWDFETVKRHALACTLKELDRLAPGRTGPLTVETLIAIRSRVAEELWEQGASHELIRLAAFERALHLAGADESLAAHLYGIYMNHRFNDIELYDDVLPTLDALQGHYTLGLLSNGNTYPDHCGLEGRFQFVVLAQEHGGITKPDPRLFEIAIAQAGCTAHELLHIGDSLREDVAGAKRAGVRSVWLNRGGRENDSVIQPDFEIRSLIELIEICTGRIR